MKRRSEAAEEAERQRLLAEAEARAAAEAEAEAARLAEAAAAARDTADAPGSPHSTKEQESGKFRMSMADVLLPLEPNSLPFWFIFDSAPSPKIPFLCISSQVIFPAPSPWYYCPGTLSSMSSSFGISAISYYMNISIHISLSTILMLTMYHLTVFYTTFTDYIYIRSLHAALAIHLC